YDPHIWQLLLHHVNLLYLVTLHQLKDHHQSKLHRFTKMDYSYLSKENQLQTK
uniref:Uncharacterized protein n=1 Tax=Amphimedon queenslandica TaxID=400682 RepID=A0A1X7SUR9_AMPQE